MVTSTKRKSDEFQAFYTNCDHIVSYMVGLLDCTANMSVLEPCAGEGIFIDKLLNEAILVDITAYELNEISVEKLKSKYLGLNNIEINREDFMFLITGKKFDRIIANPPYGAYQSPNKKKHLKKNYPGIYAKETYGLFLIRAMELLKTHGRLVFILPDTYLTLHLHEGLRQQIIKYYTIESITLFPSRFFPEVNFGYAGLSIISIVNEKPSGDHSFPIYHGLASQSEFCGLLTEKKKHYEICRLSYSQLLENPSSAFFLPSKDWINQALHSGTQTIGDICSVVTGFYSGNDAKYLRRLPSIIRGAKKYAVVNSEQICLDDLSINPPLDGIDKPSHWVPIVKGGNKRFYKPSQWFMDWGTEAILDYKMLNKHRARFQNSQFYFRQGIAVPMVSSSSITASLIDGRLFDQSIVGIFPHEENAHLKNYLLGFFNSQVCNDLIRTINASTNNSANYIKKLPLLVPQQAMLEEISKEVEKLVVLAKSNHINDEDLQLLNKYFFEVYESEL